MFSHNGANTHVGLEIATQRIIYRDSPDGVAWSLRRSDAPIIVDPGATSANVDCLVGLFAVCLHTADFRVFQFCRETGTSALI